MAGRITMKTESCCRFFVGCRGDTPGRHEPSRGGEVGGIGRERGFGGCDGGRHVLDRGTEGLIGRSGGCVGIGDVLVPVSDACLGRGARHAERWVTGEFGRTSAARSTEAGRASHGKERRALVA